MAVEYKHRLRQLLAELALALILLLTFFSIYAAFKGAEWAKLFFNSPPLLVFWLIVTIALTVGMAAFPRLRRQAGLLLIHAASVMILLGSFWGSALGHQLQNHLFQTNKIPKGCLVIHEKQAENRILSRDGQEELARLPFDLFLDDFELDYYWEHGKLFIQTPDRREFKMPARAGETLTIDASLPCLKILRAFKNFRIHSGPEGRQTVDDPNAGVNPALELELTFSDGTKHTQYIFERFSRFSSNTADLDLLYVLPVRDYFSHVSVRKDRNVIDRKTIQVNDPLHVGGYYFYQSSYDETNGRYTVLTVASDSGRALVFAGYIALIAGLVLHFWLKPIFSGKPISPPTTEPAAP